MRKIGYYQDPVKGGGGSTSLDVPQDGRTSVEAEPL